MDHLSPDEGPDMTRNRPSGKDMDAPLLQEVRPTTRCAPWSRSQLTLPADQRAPLDREQANAVANYDHARERVRLLRAWHSATPLGSDFPLDTTDFQPQS
jgi:hypothetical protein